jgi:hypothetical protein
MISNGIIMSAERSTQKRSNEIDLLMSDRTVLKRKSTDYSEARIEEEGFEVHGEGSAHRHIHFFHPFGTPFLTTRFSSSGYRKSLLKKYQNSLRQ